MELLVGLPIVILILLGIWIRKQFQSYALDTLVAIERLHMTPGLSITLYPPDQENFPNAPYYIMIELERPLNSDHKVFNRYYRGDCFLQCLRAAQLDLNLRLTTLKGVQR